MSKPIFLVQFPVSVFTIQESMAVGESLSAKLDDWHVLVVLTSVKDIEFTAFSEQAATDIELESFKEMIQNQLKQVL